MVSGPVHAQGTHLHLGVACTSRVSRVLDKVYHCSACVTCCSSQLQRSTCARKVRQQFFLCTTVFVSGVWCYAIAKPTGEISKSTTPRCSLSHWCVHHSQRQSNGASILLFTGKEATRKILTPRAGTQQNYPVPAANKNPSPATAYKKKAHQE